MGRSMDQNKATRPGLEPGTREPKSLVLPITPPGSNASSLSSFSAAGNWGSLFYTSRIQVCCLASQQGPPPRNFAALEGVTTDSLRSATLWGGATRVPAQHSPPRTGTVPRPTTLPQSTCNNSHAALPPASTAKTELTAPTHIARRKLPACASDDLIAHCLFGLNVSQYAC